MPAKSDDWMRHYRPALLCNYFGTTSLSCSPDWRSTTLSHWNNISTKPYIWQLWGQLSVEKAWPLTCARTWKDRTYLPIKAKPCEFILIWWSIYLYSSEKYQITDYLSLRNCTYYFVGLCNCSYYLVGLCNCSYYLVGLCNCSYYFLSGMQLSCHSVYTNSQK